MFRAGPSNYLGALRQVALCTFVVLMFSAWLITTMKPDWAEQAGPECAVPLVNLRISSGFAVGAVLLTLLFRIVKLHDRISDVLGIRKRYDYENIILPLYEGVNALHIVHCDPEKIHESRARIMRSVFYRYTNGKDPLSIDNHFVEMAWESLALYWAVTEALFIHLCLALALLVLGAFALAFYFGLFVIVWAILYVLAERHCIRQTNQEVTEILSSPERRKQIKASFDEILG